MTGWSQAEIKL